MNQIEVSKRLPLFKIEIFEDVDGAGHVAISECHDPQDAGGNSKSFRTTNYKRLPNIEEAFVYATNAYVLGKVDRPDPSAKFKAKHRITLKEHCRGRDGGSEWADPENDIVKSGSISIDIFVNDEDRVQHYDIGYAPFNPLFGLSNAYTTMIELMEKFLPSAKDARDIVSFEWRDRVFVEPYVMRDQLAVAGTYTDYDGQRDGEVEGDSRGPRVKVDYFRDYVHFHKRNWIYGVGYRFWMNGKIIHTVDELMELFPNANRYGVVSNGFYNAKEVLDYIKRSHPEAIGLDQTDMGSSMNFGNRGREATAVAEAE